MKRVFVLLSACAVLGLLMGAISGCDNVQQGGNGRHLLYAGNIGSSSIAAFTVSASGSPASVAGSPFDAGGVQPVVLAAVATKFLYAATPGSPAPAVRLLTRLGRGSGIHAVVVQSGGVLAFTINSDGSLGTPTLFNSPSDIDAIAVTPNDLFLYAADIASSNVRAFSINATTGALTLVNNSQVSTGVNPFSLAIDPAGKFLFVGNEGDPFGDPTTPGSVQVFAINADGTLTAVAGSPFAVGGGDAFPTWLAVSPDGKFLFVSSFDDKVYVSNIAGNGALSDNNSATLPGAGATPCDVCPSSVAVSVDGKFVYTANTGTDNISEYSVAANGTLSHIGEVNAGTSPGVILPDPGGSLVYVSNFGSPPANGSISVFTIGGTGGLSSVGAAMDASGSGTFGLATSQ